MLAYVDRGAQIHAATLDASTGKLTSNVIISSGAAAANTRPRLIANGDFAIALWMNHNDDSAWATAVQGTQHSQPTRISTLEDGAWSTLANRDGVVTAVVSATHGEKHEIISLRCRATPRAGSAIALPPIARPER